MMVNFHAYCVGVRVLLLLIISLQDVLNVGVAGTVRKHTLNFGQNFGYINLLQVKGLIQMRFFTADTHFGHDGIIGMMARGKSGPPYGMFSCIEEHDYNLLSEINSRVGRNDELIIMGDFAWNKPEKYRQQIKCKNVKLILGNHDQKTKCTNVFGELYVQYLTKIHSENKSAYLKVFCSHYAHAYWDGSHSGWGHVYGHTHAQRENSLDELFPDRRAIDVGVDNIFRLYGYWGPISEVDLYNYMISRCGHDQIRFYDSYQNQLYESRGLLA